MPARVLLFLVDCTADGRELRLLNIIDEYARECLSFRVERSIKAEDVLDELSNLLITRGIPDHIRSDNGTEFTAKPVSPWQLLSTIREVLDSPYK